MMELTTETVQYLARLASLDVTSSESETLRQHLEAILVYAGCLRGECDSEEPSDVIAWVRSDDPESGLEPGRAVLHAPDASGDFFTVPRTVEKHGS